MAETKETIGGYRLRSLLQTGQSSQVFEVIEPHSFRHFAMKILLPGDGRLLVLDDDGTIWQAS